MNITGDQHQNKPNSQTKSQQREQQAVEHRQPHPVKFSRRAAGKLHGMWLAVFDGLLFPLLAFGLTVWFVLMLIAGDVHGSPSMNLLILASLLIALPVDFLIIRAVWRAGNKPNNTSGSTPGKTHGGRMAIICLAAVIVLVGILAKFGHHDAEDPDQH